MRLPEFSFPISKCAIALLCCAFSIEPLFAQEVDWPYYGNDHLQYRDMQNIDQINPSNVSQLKPAWTFHTGVLPSANPRLTMEMTPLVVDGVMYITSGIDDVFAVNPTTGAQIWHYNPATDMPALSTLPICCGRDNRGVAYGDGLIFDARLDSNLVALNAKTGAVVWKTLVDLPSNGAAMTLAPQYVGASAGTCQKCWLVLRAANTGCAVIWTPTTRRRGSSCGVSGPLIPPRVPVPRGMHGGAPIWGTPTFDPTLNMVYFSTGNAFPWTLGRQSRGNEPILGQYCSARRNDRGIAVVFPRGPPRYVGL